MPSCPRAYEILVTADHLHSCSPGGIGNALAREFHDKGLRVFATARLKNSIKELSYLGIETLSLEVNETDSVERCKEEISALTGGGLDYLVNNAGRSTFTALSSPPTVEQIG